MKKIEYTCNLCNEVKPSKDLLCFYFKCDIIPQQYVLTNNVDSSGTHICKKCIDVIKNSAITAPF